MVLRSSSSGDPNWEDLKKLSREDLFTELDLTESQKEGFRRLGGLNRPESYRLFTDPGDLTQSRVFRSSRSLLDYLRKSGKSEFRVMDALGNVYEIEISDLGITVENIWGRNPEYKFSPGGPVELDKGHSGEIIRGLQGVYRLPVRFLKEGYWDESISYRDPRIPYRFTTSTGYVVENRGPRKRTPHEEGTDIAVLRSVVTAYRSKGERPITLSNIKEAAYKGKITAPISKSGWDVWDIRDTLDNYVHRLESQGLVDLVQSGSTKRWTVEPTEEGLSLVTGSSYIVPEVNIENLPWKTTTELLGYKASDRPLRKILDDQ